MDCNENKTGAPDPVDTPKTTKEFKDPWAQREVEIACRKECPEWDGKTWDYGVACYLNALEMYNAARAVMDNHSGYSFGITMQILHRLFHHIPLTAITEDDFKALHPVTAHPVYHENFFRSFLDKERMRTNSFQCPRYSSLFEYQWEDDTVTYSDVDRVTSYDDDWKDDKFHSGFVSSFINGYDPIRLPYMPGKTWKVGIVEFVADGYDYIGIIRGTTNQGDSKEIKFNLFYRSPRAAESADWEPVKDEVFWDAETRRNDPIPKRIVTCIVNDLIDKHTDRFETRYNQELGTRWANYEESGSGKNHNYEKLWWAYHQKISKDVYEECSDNINALEEVCDVFKRGGSAHDLTSWNTVHQIVDNPDFLKGVDDEHIAPEIRERMEDVINRLRECIGSICGNADRSFRADVEAMDNITDDNERIQYREAHIAALWPRKAPVEKENE